jgi:hypothetical protein
MPHLLAVVLVILVCAAVGVLGLLGLRWSYLRSRPGYFSCLLVAGEGAERRELVGVAAFASLELEWFARGSLSLAPARRLPRQGLVIKGYELGLKQEEGWQVVRLASGDAGFLLVMSRSAAAGLLSWIEAGPTTRTESPC